jgi:predicted regulator of Ras-like GTPase activity (Roadblock/LC7/MglB family)
VEEILEELIRCPGSKGSFIVGKDGLVIATAGTFDGDPEVIAAAAAETLVNIENSMPMLVPLDYLELGGASSQLHVMAINEVTYLLLQASNQSVAGRVRFELKSACRQLRDIL